MNSIAYMVVYNKRTDFYNVFHGDMNDPSTWVWVGGQFNTEEEAKEECYHLEQHEIGNSDLH